MRSASLIWLSTYSASPRASSTIGCGLTRSSSHRANSSVVIHLTAGNLRVMRRLIVAKASERRLKNTIPVPRSKNITLTVKLGCREWKETELLVLHNLSRGLVQRRGVSIKPIPTPCSCCKPLFSPMVKSQYLESNNVRL